MYSGCGSKDTIGPMKDTSQWIVNIGLTAGFIGLSVLGLALMAMAVTLETTIPYRVVVFILGAGGLVIGLGYVGRLRHQQGAT